MASRCVLGGGEEGAGGGENLEHGCGPGEAGTVSSQLASIFANIRIGSMEDSVG